MTSAKCTRDSLDEVRRRLATGFCDNLTIAVGVAHDAALCPVVGTPHPLDAEKTALLRQTSLHGIVSTALMTSAIAMVGTKPEVHPLWRFRGIELPILREPTLPDCSLKPPEFSLVVVVR
jgi:hypothetical protein